MPERLSLLDASFVTLDTPTTPMHAGAVALFEPGLRFSDVLQAVQARLDRVPLARKRLQELPLGARPTWVDDPAFDLTYHVRHAALPPPGDAAQLGEYCARLIGRQLDRRRPLWELYVIEGCADGRIALFQKEHLALAGSGTNLLEVLLDDHPDVVEEEPRTPWTPEPPDPPAGLALQAVRERAETLTRAARAVGDLARAPRRLVGAARDAAGSAVGVAARAARLAPESPLNTRLTPHRRFALTALDLEAMREVRRLLGGTIHDALVAVVGDAVGRLLRGRGHDTTDLDLRIMVPVRVASDDGQVGDLAQELTLGTGVVGVLAPLPIMELDPVARLYRVMGELAGLRESRQAVAAHDLVRLAGYAPPLLHAMAARLASAEQRYNLALSNAPGPQGARYLRGVRLEGTHPFIPLAGDAALSIAVTSHAGRMGVGLLGDRTGLPDLEQLADLIPAAADELLAAARAEARR